MRPLGFSLPSVCYLIFYYAFVILAKITTKNTFKKITSLWRNWSPYTWLLGIQNGTAPVENVWQVLKN